MQLRRILYLIIGRYNRGKHILNGIIEIWIMTVISTSHVSIQSRHHCRVSAGGMNWQPYTALTRPPQAQYCPSQPREVLLQPQHEALPPLPAAFQYPGSPPHYPPHYPYESGPLPSVPLYPCHPFLALPQPQHEQRLRVNWQTDRHAALETFPLPPSPPVPSPPVRPVSPTDIVLRLPGVPTAPITPPSTPLGDSAPLVDNPAPRTRVARRVARPRVARPRRVRSHECEHCHRAYFDFGALQRHLREHDDSLALRYKCTKCGSEYTQKKSIRVLYLSRCHV